ncbi:Testis-expressed sequence 10 protein-like protein, partial [Stegodyphus mimosarum]
MSDILSKVIKVLYDSEPKARHEAVIVIKGILETTTDMQIKCFFPLLTSNLTCAMTSSDFEVQKDSLDLLSLMLETHPNLICHSFNVLYDLLDMVSCPSKRSKRKRALIININSKLTSQDWRMKVMTQVRGFLRAVLASMNKLSENVEDEQEVYWDGKTPLYLPIYAGGGLKPLDVEQLSRVESTLNYCWKPEAVKQFISDIIPVLIDIFNEEVSEFASCLTKGYVLSLKSAESVQIVLQIFAILGEWIKIADADTE